MSIFTLPLRLAVAKMSAILYTEFRKEEQDMIFIGGISSAVKQLEYLKTVICSVCGSYGRYQVFMTYTYFSFFFIPLFKWNRKFYVKMTCCGSVYELDRETGMKILRGQAADIGESELSLIQRKRRSNGNRGKLSGSSRKRPAPGICYSSYGGSDGADLLEECGPVPE